MTWNEELDILRLSLLPIVYKNVEDLLMLLMLLDCGCLCGLRSESWVPRCSAKREFNSCYVSLEMGSANIMTCFQHSTVVSPSLCKDYHLIMMRGVQREVKMCKWHGERKTCWGETRSSGWGAVGGGCQPTHQQRDTGAGWPGRWRKSTFMSKMDTAFSTSTTSMFYSIFNTFVKYYSALVRRGTTSMTNSSID